jgi:hypothetical protein
MISPWVKGESPTGMRSAGRLGVPPGVRGTLMCFNVPFWYEVISWRKLTLLFGGMSLVGLMVGMLMGGAGGGAGFGS